MKHLRQRQPGYQSPSVPGSGRLTVRRLISKLAFAGLILFAGAVASCGRATDTRGAGIVTTQLARLDHTTSGGAIAMPRGPLEIAATRYDIPPGALLPPHLHRAPRYAFVETGTLAVTNMQTGATHIFHAGDVIAEDVAVWHRARNAGPDPVRLLVLDVVPPGATNVVMSNQPKR